MQYTIRKDCRICEGKLNKVHSFGNLAISIFTDRPSSGRKYPLELVSCNNCSLLQLKHTAPQELLYTRHYWYKSATNPVIVEDLKEIAKVATGYMGKADIILDIGANDGTLLSFVPKKYIRIGCEPAVNLIPKLKNKCDFIIPSFWNIKKYRWKPARVITAIGMFYDMENPNQFIADIEEALDNNGVFIAQLMCLEPMLKNNDLGNICHEHLEYYSYKSLVELYERNKLEIFKIEKNNINGGSYRIFARKYCAPSIEFPEEKPDYMKFVKNIKCSKRKTVAFIRNATEKGKKVYGYGASTKGNTILQYYGLNRHLIKGIAEVDPEKCGKYTVATKIPIIPEEEARKEADYFFALPYSFLEMFLEKEKLWRENGGKFIVSIPEFKIL